MRHVQVCLGMALLWIGGQPSIAAEAVRSEQVRSEQVRSEQVRSEQVRSEQVNPVVGAVESRMPQPAFPPISPILPETHTIRLVLKLQERRLYVYDGERIKASYPVAVGKTGWETPVGEFQVLEMLRRPGWTNPFTQEVLPPGPENPLGERWIAFWTDGTNYVGFHGTPNRESVGQFASHGCVRMFNEHVRELFEIVKIGTPVVVQ